MATKTGYAKATKAKPDRLRVLLAQLPKHVLLGLGKHLTPADAKELAELLRDGE